jgi:anti-sigma regulatory factor (Ser/Thr protein kinase)
LGQVVSRMPTPLSSFPQGLVVFKLERSVPVSHREQAVLLGDAAATAMFKSGHYRGDRVAEFKLVYTELTRNAFEHGCRHSSEVVKIETDVTISYAVISVFNSPGTEFDLIWTLGQQRELLRLEPYRRRGRGLLLALQSADSLYQLQVDGGYVIRAVIYRQPPAQLNVHQFEDLAIVRVDVSGGARVSNMERCKFRGDVLLHVIGGDHSCLESMEISAILNIARERLEVGRKFAGALPPRTYAALCNLYPMLHENYEPHPGNSTDIPIYRSFEEALRAIAAPAVAGVVLERYTGMYPRE